MKIERILSFTPTKFVVNSYTSGRPPQNREPQNSEYNPAAYRDFNISFGGRLFRTPANFYAQPFNRNGMPDTMKEYLFEDYDDRQNMPPVQMWKTVFSDINNANSLEEVKTLYPDEPLFENLNDYNGRARNSIVSEIQTLKDEFETTPLFKDGSSDLGLYIVKKIYTEGKSLKEINKDFKKDINDDYKDLIEKDIDYAAVKAFGIKFPNLAFWHSFIVTRDDFPYVYKPRKTDALRKAPETRQPSKSQIERSDKRPEPGKFDNVKDWEIEKLSGAVIKGRGSRQATQKELKKTSVRNDDSLNFVAKYLGPINSIVLDRLHISDEMKNFFEDYDNLNKSQKEKFEAYWKNSELNRIQAQIMSDTIKLFFNTYGADGNNEDFKELLDYAQSLKTQRLERQKQHDALQEEYEKTLGIFESQTAAPETNDVVRLQDDVEEDGDFAKYQKLFEDLKKEYNVEAYDFVTKDGDTISIVSNLKEGLSEQLTFDMNFIPQTFVKNFINFMVNNPRVDDSYILTTLLKAKGIKLPDDERLMPEDKAELLTLDLYQEYTDKYPAETRAAQQAVTDTFIELSKNEITPALFRLGVFEFPELYKSMRAMQPSQSKVVRDKINFTTERFNYYKRPLSDSEIRKATITIMELLRKYNPDNSIIKTKEETFKGFDTVFGAISILIKDKQIPKAKDNIKNNISNYLREYGGSARFLLDKSMPDALKTAKMEQLLCNYAYDKPGELLVYVAATNEALNYVKSRNLDLYNYLREELLSSGILYAGGGV